MSTPFLAEIKMFAGNFAPLGWALCDGSLLSIAEYDALYALMGTTYGGDGITTFGLPDLRGRTPIHQGRGIGLSDRTLGEKGGTEAVTLLSTQMPSHRHDALHAATATSSSPSGTRWAAEASAGYSDAAPNAVLATGALAPAGGGQPHENMPPFVTVNFIIFLFGIFPTSN